jgi:drug/metabolite transporter (DMT)-like permease
VALMTTLVITTAGLATLPFGWVALEPAGALGFAASAVLVSSAFLCLVAGTRTGDVSFTAPFRYVSVPLSFLIGFLIWGAIPDSWVLLGSGVVVASGLIVVAPSTKRGSG